MGLLERKEPSEEITSWGFSPASICHTTVVPTATVTSSGAKKLSPMLTLTVVLRLDIAVGVRRAGEAVRALGAGVAVELAVPAGGAVADPHAAATRLNEHRITKWRIRCLPGVRPLAPQLTGGWRAHLIPAATLSGAFWRLHKPTVSAEVNRIGQPAV